MSASKPTDVATVAAILLNWKRPDDLRKAIANIRAQTVPIDIYLWDNNPGEQFDADVVIKSSENYKCIPRWLMTSLMPAHIQYVFTLDDDVSLTKPNAIDLCLRQHTALIKQGYKHPIVALECAHVKAPYTSYDWHPRSGHGDVAKGKFMFLSRSLLQTARLPPAGVTEDDIYISSFADTCYQHDALRQCVAESRSSTGPMALSMQPGHAQRRDDAVRQFIRPKKLGLK